ncbi:MAG: FTR1 family iron permease [Amphritea sp.]|nr:FTR1 family iron permease [Amphritea sp.]
MYFIFRMLKLGTLLSLLISSNLMAATDYPLVMQQLIARGDDAAERYDPAQSILFGNEFSQLYFGGFESAGLEFAVGQADQETMLQIEISFTRLINSAVKAEPKEIVQQRWELLREQLEVAPMISNKDAGFWEITIQSLLILLREGVEALLVIGALIAYLRKAGAADKVSLIWIGAGAALVASVITAWLLQGFIQNSGAAKETLEGVTMFVAAALLSYVSVWLYARREMQQWQGFIHDKLGDAVTSGSLWAIISVAFFAVYREGAETILFYQALISDADGAYDAIATGFGLAALGLVGIYVLIFLLSVRLPLKQFFTGTAGLLYILSVIFAGKATLELQVSGWIGNTWLEGFPTISWLGVFPSVESLSAQLLLLTLPLLGWLVIRSRQQAVVPAGN